MVLFTRCITVLTVLLGLALMAVSAYAARTEVIVRIPAEAGFGATPSDPTTNGAAPSTGLSPTAMLGVPFTSMPTPTPAIVIRYPVPEGALPVMEALFGHPYDGPARIEIAQRGQQAIAGYGGTFGCQPEQCSIGISPVADDSIALHEFAHLWTEQYQKRWLAEGLA